MATWGKRLLTAIGLESDDYAETESREERPRGNSGGSGSNYYDPDDEYEKRARGRGYSEERSESPRQRERDRRDYLERDERVDDRDDRRYQDYDRDDYGREAPRESARESSKRAGYRDSGNVVQFRGSSSAAIRHHTEVITMRSYDDARAVIDNLMEERSVSINLDRVDVDLSQRIVDMLSGAIYALGASLTSTGANSYLLAPSSVEVVGSYDTADEDVQPRKGGFFGGHK